MPRYGYTCTNTACLHVFQVHRSFRDASLITFCPLCESVAERDPNDYKRIRIQRIKKALPAEAFETRGEVEGSHVHGESCGCALKKDWATYITQRLAEPD
jgi:hypothetical protein